MLDKEQVFLYIKDDIERLSKQEEKAYLQEAKKLEKDSFQRLQEASKKDASRQLEKQLNQISMDASIQANENTMKYTKILVEKRKEYMNSIFAEAKEKLCAFVDSDDYVDFLKRKLIAVKEEYHFNDCVLYVRKEDLKYSQELKNIYELNVEVKESKDIHIGGFVLENPASHVLCDETLDASLENQKDWFYKTSQLMVK